MKVTGTYHWQLKLERKTMSSRSTGLKDVPSATEVGQELTVVLMVTFLDPTDLPGAKKTIITQMNRLNFTTITEKDVVFEVTD